MLTVKQLNGVKPTGQPYRLFDGDRSGFGSQVSAKGTVTFFQQYTSPEGKRRFMNLGRYPDTSLAAARDRAAEARRVVQEGRDPQHAREEALEAEREARRLKEAELTVADAVSEYLVHHVSTLVRGDDVTCYFNRDVLPALGKKKLKDVSRQDVIALIRAKAVKTPSAARHLLVHVKHFLSWCVIEDKLKDSPAALLTPSKISIQNQKDALKPVERDRVLSEGEILSFWTSVESCGMRRLTALALKMVLVTGQRPGEVAGMRLDEIEGDVWTIPPSRRLKDRTKKPHVVPLSELALVILTEAKEEAKRRRGYRLAEPQRPRAMCSRPYLESR